MSLGWEGESYASGDKGAFQAGLIIVVKPLLLVLPGYPQYFPVWDWSLWPSGVKECLLCSLISHEVTDKFPFLVVLGFLDVVRGTLFKSGGEMILSGLSLFTQLRIGNTYDNLPLCCFSSLGSPNNLAFLLPPFRILWLPNAL